MGGPPVSKQDRSPRNDPFTPVTPASQAASPVPLASGNEIGIASVRGPVPVGNSPPATLVPATKPADALDPLVVPAWITKELDSPDVGSRLRALDTWVQTAPPGSIDPLILAYENQDERVRARAMELMEESWAREADAEK